MPTTPTRSKSLSPSLCCEIHSTGIPNKNLITNACNSNQLIDKETNRIQTNYNKDDPTKEKSDQNKKCYFQSKNNFKKMFIASMNKCECLAKSDENNNERNQQMDQNKLSIIKLPLCVRKINLDNFPPNQGQNTKRIHSITLNKIKNSITDSRNLTSNIFQKNIQFIVNEKINSLLEDYKKNFIDQALINIHENGEEAPYSNDEKLNFLLTTIEKAQKHFKNALNSSNEKINNDIDKICFNEQNGTHPDDTLKRKLCDSNDNKEETCKKSRIFIANRNLIYSYDSINQETLFVSDKNFSEIFNQSVNVYRQFPNLFKYEPDIEDKNWLLDNSIIERKSLKVNLYIYNNIVNIINDIKEDHKLKNFKVPDFILFKIKKQYSLYLQRD